MKKFLFPILLVLVPVAALAAGAPEAAEHAGFMKEWGWKIVNFAILVSVLVYFLKKPLASYLKGRTEMIEKSLAEARQARELAEKALKEVEQKLSLKESEMAEILESVKLSGGAEREALIKEAERLAEKVVEQARTNMEFEFKKARDSIRKEAVDLALELSEKRLKEKLTPDEQKKLLEEAITRLEKQG